jgi:secreted trypsin-like serine protease
MFATRLLPIALCAFAALTGSASAYVGGHDALKDKPFVAGLRAPGDAAFFCTGTLVHRSWVLTAAHCVDGDRTPAGVELVVGETNLDDATDPAETQAADRIAIHPGWGGDAGDEDDVAMVHLTVASSIAPVRLGVTPAFVDGVKRCVRIATSMSGMSLAARMTCVSGRGKALGWGRTSMSSGGTTRTLREVTPKIYGWANDTFWRVKSGACPGDSGGPLLVLAEDGSPRQIGVASYNKHGGGYFDWLYGDQCSSKGNDFYSDVSAGGLRAWIESITGVRDHRS